ncbi:hypothetical protein MTR67_022804, partial [Solanum verrucosum]
VQVGILIDPFARIRGSAVSWDHIVLDVGIQGYLQKTEVVKTWPRPINLVEV